jgi:hypothetical protein
LESVAVIAGVNPFTGSKEPYSLPQRGWRVAGLEIIEQLTFIGEKVGPVILLET